MNLLFALYIKAGFHRKLTGMNALFHDCSVSNYHWAIKYVKTMNAVSNKNSEPENQTR